MMVVDWSAVVLIGTPVPGFLQDLVRGCWLAWWKKKMQTMEDSEDLEKLLNSKRQKDQSQLIYPPGNCKAVFLNKKYTPLGGRETVREVGVSDTGVSTVRPM
jgi:hypothetical protein